MDKYNQKNKGELEKKNLRLFKGDAAFIEEHFPRAGYSIIIRNLVRQFRRQIEAKINQQEIINDDSLDELGLTITGSGEAESE